MASTTTADGAPVADPRPGWGRVRRLLAVRLDGLGDVLMCTPAIAALRQGLPGARLCLLASPAGAAACAHLSDIDDAIVLHAPWVARADAPSPTPLEDEGAIVQRLARAAFDAAVIFTSYTQSALPAALLCRLAGIPRRLAHCRENPYGLLTDWVPEPEPQQGVRHEVERQLALVRAVGFDTDDDHLRFGYRAADLDTLCGKLSAQGVTPGRPWVVVHPGASAPSRRYPAERFGQAADLIAQRLDCHVLFTGSRDEIDRVRRAQCRMRRPGTSLAGRLTLGELGALIAHANVLVSNNSGPVHLASALGTPVVDLYALTNPQHTPWRVAARVLNHDVPCRHCLRSVCPQGHHDCLLQVPAEAVARAACDLVERRADPAGRPPGPQRAADRLELAP